MNSTFLWIISGVLALLPVLIWLYILFKDKKHDKLMLALIFSGGILATIAVFAILATEPKETRRLTRSDIEHGAVGNRTTSKSR